MRPVEAPRLAADLEDLRGVIGDGGVDGGVGVWNLLDVAMAERLIRGFTCTASGTFRGTPGTCRAFPSAWPAGAGWWCGSGTFRGADRIQNRARCKYLVKKRNGKIMIRHEPVFFL